MCDQTYWPQYFPNIMHHVVRYWLEQRLKPTGADDANLGYNTRIPVLLEQIESGLCGELGTGLG